MATNQPDWIPTIQAARQHTKAARFTDLDDAIEGLFHDLQLELVCCELCGDYHPPEIHLAPATPYDASEPEEA